MSVGEGSGKGREKTVPKEKDEGWVGTTEKRKKEGERAELTVKFPSAYTYVHSHVPVRKTFVPSGRSEARGSG